MSNGLNKSFIFNDHLGSLDVVTNEAGVVTHSASFDAWGQRRNPETWAAGNFPASTSLLIAGFTQPLTQRGYTGHEHLDDMGLIHMNGRVYDPRLARFLQADPYIDGAKSTQGYNRYSYVHNNPLNATDPSGFFLAGLLDRLEMNASKPIFKFLAKNPELAQLVQVVGSAVTAAFCGACSIGFSAHYSRNLAYAQTGSYNQAFRAGAVSGISAAAFYGVGEYFNGATQVFAHGMVGGVMAELQGGKFGHGFAAAGFTAMAGHIGLTGEAGQGPTARGLIVASVIGGTASVLSGGKFANGAVTGAFSYTLNHALHPDQEKDGYREYDPTDPEYHDASSFTLLCDSAQQFGCTMQNVYENGLLYGPAPFSDLDGQVKNGQVLNLTGLGRVTVHRFDDEFRIVNATMDDHLLHPGYVERQVIQIDSKIFIRSRGVGIGNLGGANAAFTGPLWTTQDQAIIRRLPGLYPNPYSSLP